MKPSAAQLWLIHSLEFYVFGAVFGSVATIYSAFQAGTLTFPSAGIILGTALSGLVANVYKGTLQNVNAVQAVADLRAELQQSHNGLLQEIGKVSGLMTGLFHLRTVQAMPPAAQVQAAPVTPAPIAPAFTMPQMPPIDRQWSSLMPQVQAPPTMLPQGQ